MPFLEWILIRDDNVFTHKMTKEHFSTPNIDFLVVSSIEQRRTSIEYIPNAEVLLFGPILVFNTFF
jgi:hypothetical protein